MKRLYRFSAFLTPLFLLLVPVFAETATQWPPPAYDMPRVPYNPSAWSDFIPSIKMTIRSIGSTGLILLGICISVGAIGTLFHSLFLDRLHYMEGVKRRETNRLIKGLDIAFNRDSIVNEKATDMQLNAEAKALFRARNPNADMEEKIYQREIAYQANIEFARRNPDLAVLNSVSHREIAFEADNHFQGRNKVSIHKKAIDNRERSTIVDIDYLARDHELEKFRKYAHDQVDFELRQEHPEMYSRRKAQREYLNRLYHEGRRRTDLDRRR